MATKKKSIDKLLDSLVERAKELDCLYHIEEILSNYDDKLGDVFNKIIRAIPSGCKYPGICQVKITLENQTFSSPDFTITPWEQSADIVAHDMVVGTVTISYREEVPKEDYGPFLKGEIKLLGTIAERLGNYILHKKMRQIMEGFEPTEEVQPDRVRGEWQVIMQLLKQADRHLFISITRKMLNHLCWSGVSEAERLYQSFDMEQSHNESNNNGDDWNIPRQHRSLVFSADFSSTVFEIAIKHLNDKEILRLIQKWFQQEKLSFLDQVINRNLSLAVVADSIRRYHHLAQNDPDTPTPSKLGVQVSLIRRFLSDQLQYINIAKDYIEVQDFYNLLQNLIFSAESHGRLGGKSAGLYLAAQILKKKGKDSDLLSNVKIPKTWHITSDVLLHFTHYNDFNEVVEQKYKEINQVRLEYPHIVQTFKNARFPADIVNGLSVALDDFGQHPLIVRSSSLLEDRFGAAFSGKYKSLFLANQGSKKKRLDALMDAIAEVYASTFGPDPIEYRAERGLIDYSEEMGIMIQEVVGNRIGKYYLPSYAGVAFSNNEFRWSPRIKREDGLIRLVPGLGTRAVDRLSDDYPVLVAPGQPGLRVNVSPDETARYSPKKVDVLNLETNSFETIEFTELLKESGYEFPGIKDIVSIYRDNHIHRPIGMNIDFDNETMVANFDGLINRTPFVKQMQSILKLLEETQGEPVDIEFASDGRDFYLLQCRPQTHSDHSMPASIPKDLPEAQVIFTANRYVSNGYVPDITHIVYVDPQKYSELTNRRSLEDVARAISKLNKILPKRQFILMGPGRWGSRGDIKLGVNVTYSDINNTAVLIEIARKKGNYLPDLSFGTHFFQDLVEAQIRYLPLYPDDEDIIFNDEFLTKSQNILREVLPDYGYLSKTIRLIDVPSVTGGHILQILMNANTDRAVALLRQPSVKPLAITVPVDERATVEKPPLENHWRWRQQAVESIAAQIDPKRFGVKGLYLFGSAKNATARADSDIDIIVHFEGNDEQRQLLKLWLEGWSDSLSEFNYQKTGYRIKNLLDVYFVTDEDIKIKNSYAMKIGGITDPAREIPLLKKI
ncbi:MAG: PEP/pyruvate-binding domain-containing protein [Candidatus Zixiibacteriota bacterium]